LKSEFVENAQSESKKFDAIDIGLQCVCESVCICESIIHPYVSWINKELKIF